MVGAIKLGMYQGKRSHVAGIDEGREPQINDEGGRGQVTLREKEQFIALSLSFLPRNEDTMFSEKEETPPNVYGMYTTTGGTMSLSVQLFDPLG